jgi:hypothetical protein
VASAYLSRQITDPLHARSFESLMAASDPSMLTIAADVNDEMHVDDDGDDGTDGYTDDADITCLSEELTNSW